ncbi:MAG: DUF362 domain-containing protein [Candidatus Aminicenantes bacterium]
MRWSRREFIKGSVLSVACAPAWDLGHWVKKYEGKMSKVAVLKIEDRKKGVREVLSLLDYPSMKGKRVLVKPNFNTADPTPGSTHNDTLGQLLKEIHASGAMDVTVGDRSGPTPTKEVLEEKGILNMAKELDFTPLNFEDLEAKDWIKFDPEGNHWNDGFSIARPVVEAEYTVSTCCIKTHQFGGVFTLSLKNSVGVTPRNLMRELHGSSDMRKMIAEINLGYKLDLILLDGIECFVDGGPMTGTKKTANVFIAGNDRVAVDAVGIAVLKELGAKKEIMERKIFEQEQIQRASELGLGIGEPDQIEFVTPDRTSGEYAKKLQSILAQG